MIERYFTYFLIALALVGAGFGVNAKFKQLHMQVQLDQATSTLQTQDGTIRAMQDSVNRDGVVLKGLQTDLTALQDRKVNVVEKIRYLEKSNAKIADILHTDLPAGGCVLDDSCSGRDRNPSAVPATAATVQKAGSVGGN